MARVSPTVSLGQRTLVLLAALVGWVLLIVVASGRRADARGWIGLPDISNLTGVLPAIYDPDFKTWSLTTCPFAMASTRVADPI